MEYGCTQYTGPVRVTLCIPALPILSVHLARPFLLLRMSRTKQNSLRKEYTPTGKRLRRREQTGRSRDTTLECDGRRRTVHAMRARSSCVGPSNPERYVDLDAWGMASLPPGKSHGVTVWNNRSYPFRGRSMEAYATIPRSTPLVGPTPLTPLAYTASQTKPA